MSEQIIKIQSEQGFSEEAKPGAFIRKLVDFIIPGSGTYDLSRSHINVNMQLENLVAVAGETPSGSDLGTAFYNTDILLTGGTADLQAPNSQLVRNASMFSASRGMVESIRRVDTLRSLLYTLENSKTSQQNELDHLGPIEMNRGNGQATSSVIAVVPMNSDIGGLIDSDFTSQYISRDVQIPLSDLFGVGSAMWNGDVYGDTRIHCELNMNRLEVVNLAGGEDVEAGPAYYNADKFGDIAPQTQGGLGATTNFLETNLKYGEFGQFCPFYVGQAISIKSTASLGGAPPGGVVANAPSHQVITAIEYTKGSDANPPTGDSTVRITTAGTWYTSTNASNVLSDITIESLGADPAKATIRVNRAEIVLTQVQMDGPDKIDYRTYSTEIVQGNSQTTFNKQFIVEPNAQNLIMAHTALGDANPTQEWKNYQIAINNVNQTGNRAVVYGKNLHQDRLLRFFNNRSQAVHSLRLSASNVAEPSSTQTDIFPILETCPLTQSSKMVDMEIESAGGLQELILYKELVRTI